MKALEINATVYVLQGKVHMLKLLVKLEHL